MGRTRGKRKGSGGIDTGGKCNNETHTTTLPASSLYVFWFNSWFGPSSHPLCGGNGLRRRYFFQIEPRPVCGACTCRCTNEG